jgi:hypothetical protein
MRHDVRVRYLFSRLEPVGFELTQTNYKPIRVQDFSFLTNLFALYIWSFLFYFVYLFLILTRNSIPNSIQGVFVYLNNEFILYNPISGSIA